jgi:hypothetical protein
MPATANTSIPLEIPKIPPQTDAHLVLLHVFQAKLTHRVFQLIIAEMKNTKINFLPVEPPIVLKTPQFPIQIDAYLDLNTLLY